MTISRRRFRLFATIVLVVGIAAIGYGLRTRIAQLPLVSRLSTHTEPPPTAQDPERIVYWTCPMHPDVKQSRPGKHDTPDCGMPLVPVRVKDLAAKTAAPAGATRATTSPVTPAVVSRGEVTIDPRRQQLIGVRTTIVKRATMAPVITAVGQVRYDETRLADVNVKVDGWIRDLRVDYTGQPVAKGQPLFTLYSPELLATEQEYLLALRTRDQLQQSMVPDARERAERLVLAARQRLALWDISSEHIGEIERTRQAQATVTFRSPVAGFVTEKQALQGMHVTAGQTLYRIADLSVVWIEADFRENEVAALRVGQRATVRIDAYPDAPLTGRVTYVYPTVDEQTRTAKVRVELANRGGRLKPGMYARVDVSASSNAALIVPTDALLDSGKEQIVFIAEGDGYFRPQRVTVGRRLEDAVEIIAGLAEGQQIATGAAFFLDSESQLRASLEGFQPIASTGPAAAREQLDITLRSEPDPPKTGENTFEVVVKDKTGNPISDGDVSLQFYMPAMPTMNMPAMRNTIKLTATGGGVYRGRGEIMMAGRWDVTITVSRGGQRLGSKQIALVAR